MHTDTLGGETLGGSTPDQPDRLDAPLTQEANLFVVLECDRPLAGGARYSLGYVDVATIGRGKVRHAQVIAEGGDRDRLDLRLPSPLLSTNHLRLTREGDDWVIEDTGSRNGTYVNLRSATRQILRDGDLIEIGRVLLRFRLLPVTRRKHPVDPNIAAIAAPIGFSTLLPALATGLHELSRLASSALPILLLGETGTGKEVIARGIHELSGRTGELVAVNCGALSGTLLDAQLFGHVKGSFTGALRDELGFVRASDGGTLFLDEIGDLPLPAQAALLRVLQEREVVPVGSTKPVKVDLRLIAATHRKLDLLAARGEFRPDLYARLSGHVHYLAPLRDRREDLGLLIAELLARSLSAGTPLRLAADAGRALVTNEWPLNIRQLEQALSRAVTLAEDGVIHARHLTGASSGGTKATERSSSGEFSTERSGSDWSLSDRTPVDRTPPPPANNPTAPELRALLEKHHGNITEVARALHCSRTQVHRLMQRYGFNPDDFRR